MWENSVEAVRLAMVRTRLQQALEAFESGRTSEVPDLRYLRPEPFNESMTAAWRLHYDHRDAHKVENVASKAALEYVEVSRRIQKASSILHKNLAVISKQDSSQKRVLKKQLAIQIKQACALTRKMWKLKKALTPDDLSFLRFETSGRCRWQAKLRTDGEYFAFPPAVQYAEHIRILTQHIALLDQELADGPYLSSGLEDQDE